MYYTCVPKIVPLDKVYSVSKPRTVHAWTFALIWSLVDQPGMCAAAGMAVGVASPCGKLKNFSRLAKLVAERDLEDYMGIPDTNVNGCWPYRSGPRSQLGNDIQYKSRLESWVVPLAVCCCNFYPFV